MPTLQDYAKKVVGRPCRECGRPFLEPVELRNKDHSGGWEVDGFEERQWLFVICPACKCEFSIWKLGIVGDDNVIHKNVGGRIDAEFRASLN